MHILFYEQAVFERSTRMEKVLLDNEGVSNCHNKSMKHLDSSKNKGKKH